MKLLQSFLKRLLIPASMSRLYGAIHYRSDREAGLVSGKSVRQFAVNRAMTDGAE